MKIVVTTLEGMEEVCAAELAALHLQNIQLQKRSVACEGNWTQLYKCNYLLRTAIRVLVPIYGAEVTTQDEYYEAMRSIDWSRYISEGKTFAISAAVFSDIFTNSLFATYRVKDAILDQLRDEKGYRPNIDIDNPDIAINVHLNRETLSVSLDSTGRSLHLRGYKERAYKAPLNEVFAAGIIKLSGWDMKQPFYDPMCGSGTFTTEALMLAAKIPAGKFIESFCFQNWPEYEPDMWESVTKTADAEIQEPECEMYASDINSYAVRDLRKNLQRLSHKKHIQIKEQDFLEASGRSDVVLFLNPPYDQRVKVKNVTEFYRKIADALKTNWQGSTAWVLSGNAQAMKSFGLKYSAKISMDNGGIPTKLYKFEMYAGSKKSKYQNDEVS